MSYAVYENFEKKLMHYFQKYNVFSTNHDNTIVNISNISQISKNFFEFYCRITTENKKYNLTSITDEDEIILKHFVDSVIILKYLEIPFGAKIIDIGTGAGFPALPIYIMRNDLKITFIDSSAKKINFIRDTIQLLDIAGDTPLYLCGRAEDVSREKDFREAYDFAVSRAVAKLNVLCELAAPLICTNGHFISYKGKNADAETAEAKNAMKILGLEVVGVHKFNMENICKKREGDEVEANLKEAKEENKRALIDIRKAKHTAQIYPRNYSKITKNPL